MVSVTRQAWIATSLKVVLLVQLSVCCSASSTAGQEYTPNGSAVRLGNGSYLLVEKAADQGSLISNSHHTAARFLATFGLSQSATSFDTGSTSICIASATAHNPCREHRKLLITISSVSPDRKCVSGSCITMRLGSHSETTDMLRNFVDVRQSHEMDIELSARDDLITAVVTDQQTQLSAIVRLKGVFLAPEINDTNFITEVSAQNANIPRTRRVLMIAEQSMASGLYTVIDISAGNPCVAEDEAMNEFGAVVGYLMRVDPACTVEYPDRPWTIWTDTDPLQQFGDQYSAPLHAKINASGQVAAQRWSAISSRSNVPVFWDPAAGFSTITNMGDVIDLNDSGDVIGSKTAPGSPIPVPTHVEGFLWSKKLGYLSLNSVVPPGKTSRALSIDNDGVVIGSYGDEHGSKPWTLFRYDRQHGLTVLAPSGGSLSTFATNHSDQLVVSNPGGAGEAIWDQTTGFYPLPISLNAVALNDALQIVGTSDGKPVIWDRNQGLRSVNSLLDPSTSSGWTISKVVDINRQGWILAAGSFAGKTMPVMLKPADISQVFSISTPFSTSNQPLGSALTNNVDAILKWHPNHLGFNKSFSIWPLGDFGGSADLSFGTDAGLRFGYSVSPGTASVSYSGTILLEFPDKYDLVPGRPFTIQSHFILDPSSAVSTTPPSADAQLTALFDLDLSAHLSAKAFGDDILNVRPFPAVHRNESHPLFGLKDALGGSEDRDYSLANGIFTGHVHSPHVVVQGSGDGATSGLSGRGQDLFLGLNMSFSQALASLFGASLDFPVNASIPSLGGASGHASVLQLSYRSEIGLAEDVRFTAHPIIDLTFPGTEMPSVQFAAGETSPAITLPPTPAQSYVTVAPRISLPNNLANRFSAEFFRSLSFVPLHLGLSIDAAGYDLLTMDDSLGAVDSGYSLESFPFASSNTSLTFPDIHSAPLSITSKLRPAPTISSICAPGTAYSSCPTSVDLIIISDRLAESTAKAQFISAVTGSTLLTVRGSNFWPKETKVEIAYYGSRYEVDADVRNSATLQFELPNEVRVVPGVMQIIVTTTHSSGPSNSHDFSVVFPVPQIDSASPSLWAADPHFKDVVVSITGSNFIDRPDYFADQSETPTRLHRFWHDALPARPALAAQFPAFPFNKLSYPVSILWNHQELSLYPEPAPTGAVPSLLPPNLYDHSQLVPISLQNPGPGGGISPTPYVLWVAAPVPVILTVDPPSAVPQPNGSIRIALHGSSTLPSSAGDKATGFEANSAVLLDGNPLPTTFISSTDLVADVPIAGSGARTTHSISVENPYVDQTGSGVYTSLPISWQLMNPVPAITALQPSRTCVDAEQFQAEDRFNLIVNGNGFVPGSSALVNGDARDVRIISSTSLAIGLLPTDVQMPQTLNVIVQNPTPGGGTSNSSQVLVTTGQPLISGVTPDQLTVGTVESLQISGTGFRSGIRAIVNGSPRRVRFGSDHEIRVDLSAQDVAEAGSLLLTLVNDAPDFCNSKAVKIPVH